MKRREKVRKGVIIRIYSRSLRHSLYTLFFFWFVYQRISANAQHVVPILTRYWQKFSLSGLGESPLTRQPVVSRTILHTNTREPHLSIGKGEVILFYTRPRKGMRTFVVVQTAAIVYYVYCCANGYTNHKCLSSGEGSRVEDKGKSKVQYLIM